MKGDQQVGYMYLMKCGRIPTLPSLTGTIDGEGIALPGVSPRADDYCWFSLRSRAELAAALDLRSRAAVFEINNLTGIF